MGKERSKTKRSSPALGGLVDFLPRLEETSKAQRDRIVKFWSFIKDGVVKFNKKNGAIMATVKADFTTYHYLRNVLYTRKKSDDHLGDKAHYKVENPYVADDATFKSEISDELGITLIEIMALYHDHVGPWCDVSGTWITGNNSTYVIRLKPVTGEEAAKRIVRNILFDLNVPSPYPPYAEINRAVKHEDEEPDDLPLALYELKSKKLLSPEGIPIGIPRMTEWAEGATKTLEDFYKEKRDNLRECECGCGKKFISSRRKTYSDKCRQRKSRAEKKKEAKRRKKLTFGE